MASLNKVMLIGNVGVDPEMRYVGQGNNTSRVANFRLATTDRYTDRNGEVRESTEWHTVYCWNRLADVVDKYVKKGSQIYVEGSIRSREYTDQNGMKKTAVNIVCDNLQLLGSRSQGQRPDTAPSQNPGRPAQQSVNHNGEPTTPLMAANISTENLDNDDLPF